MRDATQVLVVGGGPAGSTAAGLLAREGFDVTLMERERFPRYHIGESILPSCLPIFDLLGVRRKIEAHGFQRKDGAFFFWGPEEWEVRFAELGEETPNAWQVVRSEFDQLLLDHAREQGVRVLEGVAVRAVEFEAGRAVAAGWSATDSPEAGRMSFDFLVDASGRGGVMATRHLRSRRFHEVFRNVAAWAYWRGAKAFTRGPGGAIVVCSIPTGWFWAIPLHDGTLSVGLVSGKDWFNQERNRLGGVAAVYERAMRECPPVMDLLAGAARISGIRVEQDYSYVSERLAGPGYVLSGDAACFLDPLLSTGVHLATYSALLAAATVSSVIRGEVAEEWATDFYATVYREAYERLLVLVSVFYESYRGQEYHFYNAQRLRKRERDRLDLCSAFLRIVSGIEDLEDAKDAAYARVREHLTGAQSGNPNPLANLNRIHEQKQAPMSPENAVHDLYLVVHPRLGLRRAGVGAAAGAPGHLRSLATDGHVARGN